MIQTQYQTKKEMTLEQINDLMCQSDSIQFVSGGDDCSYHLSQGSVESTIAVYDVSVQLAGVVAPINTFGSSRDKSSTKKILEEILRTELIEIVPFGVVP